MMAHPPRRSVASDLPQHRTRIVRLLLVGLALLGLVAYVPSVWAAVYADAWSIAILDTAVYLAILGVLAFGRNNYVLQAGVVVGVCFVLGIALSLMLGPTGGGPLWLLAAPIAAAILYDRRGALVALACVAAGAVLIPLAWRYWAVPSPSEAPTYLLWAVLSGNMLLLTGALTLAVTRLIRGLQQEMARRQRVESQLLQSEKLQAVGTLAAGIAHDFNNLLTPILSAAEMARQESAEGSNSRAALDSAIEAALTGRSLIARILAFSRPSGEGRSPIRAGEILNDAVRLLRASIPDSIAVNLEVEGDGLILIAPAEVHQLVLNLGTNAWKAMPEGGSLDFRLRALDSAEIEWHGRSERPEAIIRLQVTDTGVGMAPEVASRVFDPFFTTNPERGSGIGLATVHGIVTSAGGQVRCESTPGAGTTFTLDLPVLRPDFRGSPAPHPIQAPTAGAVRGAGARGAAFDPDPDRHILLVDDDEAVRRVTRKLLERSGFPVSDVTDGPAALALLEQANGGISLVLSDLNMPGMNGLELAERVRARHPDVAVVLMSGLVDEALRGSAREAGVDGVVAKPFQLDELLEAVRAAQKTV